MANRSSHPIGGTTVAVAESPVEDTRPADIAPTRRAIVKGGLTGLVIGAPTIITSSRASAAGRKLVVANFGGIVGEAKRAVLYDPFTRETGIEVVSAYGLDLAKMKLQAQTGDVVWDVVDLSPSWLPAAIRFGVLERIDNAIVRRNGCMPQAYSDYAVGASIFSIGIGYTSDRLGNRVPRNWAQFWDTRSIPGRRTLMRRITDTLEIALLADGVPPAHLYPCDIERAFRSLDRIKPYVNHWVAFTEQTVSLIQQDETDFSATYTTRVRNMRASGARIGFAFEQNLLGVLWTGVMKNAPNREAAMRFCAFAADPDRQVALANITCDAPVYPGAVARVAPAIQRWLPRIDQPGNVFTNPFWWDRRIDALTLRFQDWLFS